MILHARSGVLNVSHLNIKISIIQNFSTKIPIAAGYKPLEVESRQQLKWAETETCSTTVNQKPKFSMILPPPNVTGKLHLGHALNCTIADVIRARKLQQGYNVIWVPGTDHAGIATQAVVEKKLFRQKGIKRHQMMREAFLEEVWSWKNEKEESIKTNLKRLGCSLNWEREYFTMDNHQKEAVRQAFVRLFDDGFIKRKRALVNWSCSLESAISDIEVDVKEITEPTMMHVPGHDGPVEFGKLYDIAYKVVGMDEEVIVSTTRPETLLGDVAIAVHPGDERFSKFQGRGAMVWHPFRKEPIPIIFDESVERDFGTGAVKITPAHDKSDFEVALRHSLPSVSVFTATGCISDDFTNFAKLPRFKAREKVLEALSSLNLFRGSKSHSMNLPLCSRSGDVIEYMLRPQWFLECTEMAHKAMEVVRNGTLKIVPSNFEAEWFRWLGDCKDWCISRQLWWGHQIPAFECTYDGNSTWIAAASQVAALQRAGELFQTNPAHVTANQDPDVLDTWFSSSLLPFSAFGWPNSSGYKEYYPLDVMITGHDILFFWVARMVMMGHHLTGEIPFRKVLLNGIICDVHGRKMSKSLGNVILPEDVIYGARIEDLKNEVKESYNAGILTETEVSKSNKGLQKMFPNGIPECGSDALRFTLCSHNIKSHFINFDVNECRTNRLFFNKIWQATRFTLNCFDKLQMEPSTANLESWELGAMDKWILSRLGNTKRICNQSFEQYNFHVATSALKTFFYTNLCDVYLETTKKDVNEGSERGRAHCAVLAVSISLGLQAMSPFTPHLSDECSQYFPKFSDFVCSHFIDDNLEDEVNEILSVCSSIRQFKSKHQITGKHEPRVHLFPENHNALKQLCKFKDEIQTLSLCQDVVLENASNHKRKGQFNLISTAGHLCSFGITTNDKFTAQQSSPVINVKKLEKLQNDLSKLLRTVSSDGYKKSAHESIQKKHLERLKQLETEINSIKGMS